MTLRIKLKHVPLVGTVFRFRREEEKSIKKAHEKAEIAFNLLFFSSLFWDEEEAFESQ